MALTRQHENQRPRGANKAGCREVRRGRFQMLEHVGAITTSHSPAARLPGGPHPQASPEAMGAGFLRNFEAGAMLQTVDKLAEAEAIIKHA